MPTKQKQQRDLRNTFDIYVVAEVQIMHVVSLVKRLEAEYYIDADMIRDAIHHQSSFNPHGIMNGFPAPLRVLSPIFYI